MDPQEPTGHSDEERHSQREVLKLLSSIDSSLKELTSCIRKLDQSGNCLDVNIPNP